MPDDFAIARNAKQARPAVALPSVGLAEEMVGGLARSWDRRCRMINL